MTVSDCASGAIVSLCSHAGHCTNGFMVLRETRNVKSVCACLVPVVKHGTQWQLDYSSRMVPIMSDAICYLIKE